MQAIELRTDYLKDPIGLGDRTPEFFWKCAGGKKQTAYQILVTCEGKLLWNSGKVPKNSMTHIRYEGKELKSRMRAEWKVLLWDENNLPGESAEAMFEMGLLEPSDWEGTWISGDYRPKKNMRWPVDCFLKEFSVQKPVKKARLYITACGLYEASVNGIRAGEYVLAPGCTDYRKRIQYQTYDVTGLIKAGLNRLEVLLADGWYRGSIGCFGQTNVFGRKTKLICQLELTGEDGNVDVISSDQSFRWSNDGAVRFADLKDGEVVEAGNQPSYSGKARKIKEKVIPSSADNVIIREQEHFKPELLKTPSGKKVLDFGQNMAGFLAFSVQGEKGKKIHLTLG